MRRLNQAKLDAWRLCTAICVKGHIVKMKPTPEAFFEAAKKELPRQIFDDLRKGDWSEEYHNNAVWTKMAIQSICRACGRFAEHIWAHDPHLPDQARTTATLHGGEYLNLDIAAYDREPDESGDDHDNWRLRVVVEHENAADVWTQELNKLADVVADLRVLVIYMKIDRVDGVAAELQARVDRLRDHIKRVPDSRWLFIVGPWQNSTVREFLGFTLDDVGEAIAVKQLSD